MTIDDFMQGYKARGPQILAALFHPDGLYRNTPFQVQRGTAALMEYWKRVQLHEDVRGGFEILAHAGILGIANWHVSYALRAPAAV